MCQSGLARCYERVMPMRTNRRTLLKLSLGSLAGLALPGWSMATRAQSAASSLRENVSVIDAGGSNVLVCETNAGLVLVDSGVPDFASRLMEQLGALGDGRVHTLFNTHWHLDQCGGNELIGKTGAAIVAH